MTWWYRLWHGARMEEQLDKELRFHLDEYAADLIGRGYEPAEARRQAVIALGGPEQVKEGCRDARGTRWLQDFAQDFRYALRTFKQRPVFAAVALLTLALGIGATTLMFTVINGVLLKPLPFPEPDRLVNVQEQTDWTTHWGNLWAFSYPNFLDCRREVRTLTIAAWRWSGGTVSKPGDAQYVERFEISSDLLPVLGVKLSQGRNFLPEEDRPGAERVAIVSYSFWQRRFAGTPSVGNTSLTFDDHSYTIIGVTPAGFRLGEADVDLLTPIGQNTSAPMQNREAHPGIQVLARLRPGTTLAQATAELSVVGKHLAVQYPKSNRGRTFVAEHLRPDVGDARSTLWLLLGAVSLVLLIGCINVASLLLARAVSRERELAVRMALGAGRGRLIRQCLTESVVLSLSGAVLGVILAAMGIRPFLFFWPGSLPRAEEVQLDWRVLLFALASSVLCGVLFGLAPALQARRQELELALRAGSRTVAGGSRRLHSAFVSAEIALALVLLVCAGMLGRTLLHLSSLDPGIDVHNIVTARAALSPATLKNPALTHAAWDELLERTRRVPGVQAAAVVDTVPLREGNNVIGYWTSAAVPPPEQQPVVLATSVSPEYFKVLRIPLRKGRFFNDHDRMGNAPVAIIDEVMARQAFGSEQALGKRLWIGLGTDPLTVVGVVGHVRYWGAGDDERAQVRAQLYYPFAQVPDPYVRRWSELMSIAVRTSGPPLNIVEPLRHELRGATADQVLYEVNTMEQLASRSLARQRFLLLLFGIFAGFALLLACIGIYGVLAYLTIQRVPEFGVRMALGASATQILRLVFRQSLGMLLLGISVGTCVSIAAAHVLEQQVEGMRTGKISVQAISFAVTIPVLLVAGFLASFLPAQRASHVDPVQALRNE